MHRLIPLLVFLLHACLCLGQSELLHKYIAIQHQRMHYNGVVLVTKDNQPLFRESIGQASLPLNVPMNPDAVFKVASISKQFTAMLVTLAFQEGRLRAEDSLALFFPELKDTAWRSITLHQLLSHTSGIPHNEGIPEYWTLKSRLPLSKEQALAEIFNIKLLFKPGTDRKYSSLGYYLLACILETAYRRTYEALLTEKVLQPLHMNHTGVYVPGKVVPGMVSAYHLVNDSLIEAPYRDFSLMKGSGDLYSNAEDLATWNNSFSGTWNSNLQKLLFTPHTSKAPHYGYGWFIRSGKRPAYYHGGGTFGCSALSAWYPNEKVSVVILSNVSVLPVTELWNDIEKILFNEPFDLPLLQQAMPMSSAALQAFTGRYGQHDHTLQILLMNDQLYAKLGANPPFEIYPEGGLKFFGKKVTVQLTFNADGEGKIISVDAAVRGQVHHFNKK